AKTETWGIDPEKQRVIEEIARRYLAGESLAALAKEYRIALSSLHRTLTERCGEEWVQEFHSERLNLHEVVVTKVPALLPDGIVEAVRRKAEANKTFTHGQAKNRYLLGRVVFCAECGYAMSGHRHTSGRRYYRHLDADRLAKMGMKPCRMAGTQ